LSAKVEPLLLFAKMFFKHPFSLGSLLPSSSSLTRHLLTQVAWAEARVVVEYGPGVGTLTAEILRRLRPDGVLVAIENNAEFVAYLRRSFSDDRLRVCQASAADAAQVLATLGLEQADVIISGIPYSTMPDELRERILEQSRNLLRPGGTFLVYQFTSAVVPHLWRLFGNVRQEIEFRNLLPARIFCCVR
jgi:phospholipid N-methyltransferase